MHRTAYFESKPPCPVCEDKTHGVAKCPTIAERPIEDKRAFVRENQLCFGCLWKGHFTNGLQTATHMQYMWPASSNLPA